MLSAVAARKAAKAAAAASAAPSPRPPSPPSSSSIPEERNEPIEKPPKRKPRASANATSRPKPKRTKIAPPVAKTNVRYFNDENPKSAAENDRCADVVAVSDSDSDSSAENDFEMKLDDVQQIGISNAFPSTQSKRAWSPSRPIADSSDEEEPSGSVSFALPPQPTKVESAILSTFRPVHEQNIWLLAESESPCNQKSVILLINPNESVALVGAYTITVLQGRISLLGATLTPSSTRYRVFAPRSSPIPVLSWVEAPDDLTQSAVFSLPSTIRPHPKHTVILLQPLKTGVEGLGRICRVFDGDFKPPRDPTSYQNVGIHNLNIILRGVKGISPFILSPSWRAALASIDAPRDVDVDIAPICVVRGPKKSGKSTFARTLVNRLLSRYCRVAFLECDLGQSEFTPGGMVSLNLVEQYIFGPPFTHPTLPYRAHYLGATSPRSSPSHYLSAIQALIETYKQEIQVPTVTEDSPTDTSKISDTVPLVVNTMGWTKGLGADLNARIDEFVEPSHVFEIIGPEEKGWPAPPQVPHGGQNQIFTPFYHAKERTEVKLEAISPDVATTSHTAIDYRNLNVLSYFHAIFPDVSFSHSFHSYSFSPPLRQITAESWDTSLPLCASYPYEMDYTQALDHVCLSGSGYEDVVPSELSRALNGAIVGLVSLDPGASLTSPPLQRPSQLQPSTIPTDAPLPPLLPYTPGQPPPSPTFSSCPGLALIRAFSPSSPHMHVLTPLPSSLLPLTRTLVKGELELPVWGMLDFREGDEGGVAGVDKGNVPYLQWGKGEGLGSEKRRARRNLMRRGQL
ncbi:hypothetical protein F5I97DRAFT_964674 [Phlebopus sp. FC_14]|nr:hypothetical protein F5I97DRAFT_964674 [Phlebopus sp. FC_14]